MSTRRDFAIGQCLIELRKYQQVLRPICKPLRCHNVLQIGNWNINTPHRDYAGTIGALKIPHLRSSQRYPVVSERQTLDHGVGAYSTGNVPGQSQSTSPSITTRGFSVTTKSRCSTSRKLAMSAMTSGKSSSDMWA